MTHIFTYGSLMNEKLMNSIVKRKYKGVKATLDGYIRRKVFDFDFPAIVEDKQSKIVGVLWMGVDQDDIQRLDHYESQGYLYTKINVNVIVNGKQEPSIVYYFIQTHKILSKQWIPQQYGVTPAQDLDLQNSV